MGQRDLAKAALRGEPSYAWRAGQQRRLEMIVEAVGERIRGRILEDGCGVGMYLEHLTVFGGQIFGLEYDFERAGKARQRSNLVTCAAGEALPYPAATFDLVISHEVLEHVDDDRQAACEIVRTLKPGGRLALFVPNRGYPFETHGITWHGTYHFGNIPLVNYLPRGWRNKLAAHVKVYSRHDLEKLFAGLPVRTLRRTIIFGAYDNLIARYGTAGKLLRGILQLLEKTPLKAFGLSHFWSMEKLDDA